MEHKVNQKPELDALRKYNGDEAELYGVSAKLFTEVGLLLCESGKMAELLF